MVLPVATPRDLVVQLRGTAAAVMSIAAFAGLKCGGSNEDICYGQYFAKPNNDGGAGRDFVVSGSYVRIAAVRAELVREGEKKVADDERSQKTSARLQQRANIIPFPLVAALDFLESHTFPSLLSSLSSTDRWVPPRRPVSWLAELHEGFQLQCATEEAEWATMPGKQQAGSRGGKKGESRGKSWGEGRGEGWGEGKEGGEDKNEDVCEDDVRFYSDRAQQEHYGGESISEDIIWQYKRRMEFHRELLQDSWPGSADVVDMNELRRARQDKLSDSRDTTLSKECQSIARARNLKNNSSEEHLLSIFGAICLWKWMCDSGKRSRRGAPAEPESFRSDTEGHFDDAGGRFDKYMSIPGFVSLVKLDFPDLELPPRLSWAWKTSGDAPKFKVPAKSSSLTLSLEGGHSWPSQGYTWGGDAHQVSQARHGGNSAVGRWERLVLR